ncbi:hypothetical protein K443DRAFT_101760, partial [Laccaria amethystina LaAM-08-1]
LMSSLMPRRMMAQINGRNHQNDVVFSGRLLLTMGSLAPYRPAGLNSRTPGICPPSPHHPSRHRSRSHLGYTQAPRGRSHQRNSSHATSNNDEQVARFSSSRHTYWRVPRKTITSQIE